MSHLHLCGCVCSAAAFATERLQRSGGCHESEVAEAFRKTVPRLRSTDAMPDSRVRDFVRAWHPDVRITPNGFWKVGTTPWRCLCEALHDTKVAANSGLFCGIHLATAHGHSGTIGWYVI